MNKVQKGVNFVKCTAFNNIVKVINRNNDVSTNKDIKDIIEESLNEIERIKRKYNEN